MQMTRTVRTPMRMSLSIIYNSHHLSRFLKPSPEQQRLSNEFGQRWKGIQRCPLVIVSVASLCRSSILDYAFRHTSTARLLSPSAHSRSWDQGIYKLRLV